MTTATIDVWYDPNGQIIAIGRAAAKAKGKAIPVAGHNQAFLEAQIEESAMGARDQWRLPAEERGRWRC